MNRHEGRLLYDSGRESSKGQGDRTLLFRSDPFSVDLVVTASSDDVGCFQGHVVSEGEGLPVVGALITLDPTRQAAVTNEYGEFSVSSPDLSRLQYLIIGTEDEEVVCTIPAIGALSHAFSREIGKEAPPCG